MTGSTLDHLTVAGYPAAAAVEVLLGDAEDSANPAGFAAAVRRDQAGAPASEIASLARSVGLQLSYLPAELGGNLTSFDETLARVRMFARRDASVMPSTMFSVTAMTCLLLHGSAEQQRRAIAVLQDGGSIAFALSEPDSGSDLLGNAGKLTPAGEDWSLDATKWLVGQGADSELVYVVARTAPRGPIAFSAVLLERNRLKPGTVTGTLHSAGLTGVGLDTLVFDAQPVAAHELVGKVGQGLEAALKSMQIVRLLSTAASLGCADAAVRSTLRFLAGHRVAGAASLEWAPARRELAIAAGWLIAMDAVSVSTARLLHVRPEAFTLPSAVVKRIATEAGARIIDGCSDLQASRSVLTGAPAGLLAKLRRDVETVRYIDTSPTATLRLLASQLPGLAAAAGPERDSDAATAVLDRAARVFTLGSELAAYEPARLDLATRDDDVINGFRLVLASVTEALSRSADPLAPQALRLTAGLGNRLEDLLNRVRADSANPARDGGVRALANAAEFATLYAAAGCLQLWWWNRDQPIWDQAPGSLRWLVPALAVLIEPVAALTEDLAPAAELVTELDERGLLFSVVALPLADGGAR